MQGYIPSLHTHIYIYIYIYIYICVCVCDSVYHIVYNIDYIHIV